MFKLLHVSQVPKVAIVALGYVGAAFFIYWYREAFVTAFFKISLVPISVFVGLFCLSAVNWGLESLRWHVSLSSVGIKQNVFTSIFHVLYAQPLALLLGKLAGNSFGRISFFLNGNWPQAIKAQALSAIMQSAALVQVLLFFVSYDFFNLYGHSARLACALLLLVLCLFIPIKVNFLFGLSILRLGVIFMSYAIALNLGMEHGFRFFSALAKTFAVLTFLPFSPLATMGSKEWLIHYWHPDFSLETIIAAGTLVFIFNNLIPATIGLGCVLRKKWD